MRLRVRVLPSPFDPIFGLVGYDDDFRGILEGPSAEEDVDGDCAKAAGKGGLLSRDEGWFRFSLPPPAGIHEMERLVLVEKESKWNRKARRTRK